MDNVQPVVTDDVRVIMCLAFDHRAPVTEVGEFKTTLVQDRHVVSCCDLHGSFDFMLEVALPDLSAYNAMLEVIRQPLASLVSRYETNFVCNRLVKVAKAESDRVVWVPCQDGVKRVDCSFVDKVTAEGDYMRVHADGHSWLVHLTMGDMMAKLGTEDFVQLHRSTIVRSAFIDRLVHEGRLWTARLNDGSAERIARSHVAEVMAKLRTSSSTREPGSSNGTRVVDRPFMLVEKPLQHHS
jgi:DNA-binding LytR/AlgR family response regulator